MHPKFNIWPSKTPEYFAWNEAKRRCTNPRHQAWHHYGGRGITMCERWLNSFDAFLEDMGRRPPNPPGWKGKRPYWSLDRIDNDGPYSPENCRWATYSQQESNKREKTHCKWGHDRRGRRGDCLVCSRIRDKARQPRRTVLQRAKREAQRANRVQS